MRKRWCGPLRFVGATTKDLHGTACRSQRRFRGRRSQDLSDATVLTTTARCSERRREQLFQLAALTHRAQDVGITVESAVDEDLRQRRPIRELAQCGALLLVCEHVDHFKRPAELLEELNGLQSKPATGC